jgi:UDP-glucose 4-epimerase
LETKRVLVTGGAGFVGSHLVERLCAEGWEVTVIDDLTVGRPENIAGLVKDGKVRFLKGSITDARFVNRCLKDIEVVFHEAAISSVAKSIASPELVNKVNVEGTFVMLDQARIKDVGKFVFASSAALYGNEYPPPHDEGMTPHPESPYGATKACGEAYCTAFYETYGLGTVALRYFNVYGPRSGRGGHGGVLMNFARNLVAQTPIEIFGDGLQTRDFVFVKDVVESNLRAAESQSAVGKAINVGTGEKTTINRLAEIMNGEFANKGTVIHREGRGGEIHDSWASVSKVKRELGYIPSTRLSEGIQEFFAWYRTFQSSK